MNPRQFSVLAALGATLLPLHSAIASSPCYDPWPHGESIEVLPADGETGVPTNSLIWFTSGISAGLLVDFAPVTLIGALRGLSGPLGDE